MTEASQPFPCHQLSSASFPPSTALALVFVQLCDELDQEIWGGFANFILVTLVLVCISCSTNSYL